MKKKFTKILGVGLAFMLVVSLMAFALPVLADPDEEFEPEANEWSGYYLKMGADGDWFYDPDIMRLGPMAQAINGDLYIYVMLVDTPRHHIFKSTDGGRTWAESTSSLKYGGTKVPGLRVRDMVCSSLDEDIVYVTDGYYVYKSVNGGDTWAIVAENSLEMLIVGECGPAVDLHDESVKPITCLDVSYNTAEEPFAFIGVEYTDTTAPSDGEPSVLYINEVGYPSEWTDLQLHCYRADGSTPGGYIPYAIGCEPGFADSKKTIVLVSNTSDELTPRTPLGANPPMTHVISTVGVTCSWSEIAELVWDCDSANPFAINEKASRFAFPDDYEDTLTVFIGVSSYVDEHGGDGGGDVYAVTPCASSPCYAIDLNVRGFTSGCAGLKHANIHSLDIVGGTDDGSLIAGARDDYDEQQPTNVYYSSDGGWTWDDSDKDPTGGRSTYVLWVGDSALAATRGCDCAVSLSCGEEVGEFFNQISLISTDINAVLDISHAPGYLTGTSMMFLVTRCDDCCDRKEGRTWSVFRYDQTYWERVWSSTIFDDIFLDWVEVSPDFNTTDCVYLANREFDMFRTVDAGCSWKMLSYPCLDKPDISAWVVIDEETVLAGGSGSSFEGTIYKTTRHGSRPWKEYTATGACCGIDFDLSPSIDTDDSVLYGDTCGHVFISEDLGEEWDEVVDASDTFLTANTYVIFDPGYGTSGDEGELMIYAAAGTDIWRCDIDTGKKWNKQNWKKIYALLTEASGIDAAGDTALYVSDYGVAGVGAGEVTVDGTVAVRCPETGDTADLDFDLLAVTEIIGDFEDGELVEIIEYNMDYLDSCNADGCVSISGWIELQGESSFAYNDLDVDGCIYDVVGTFEDGEALFVDDWDLWFDQRFGTDRVTGWIEVLGVTSGTTGYVDILYYDENFMPGGDEPLDVDDWDLKAEITGLWGLLGIKGHDSGATGTVDFYVCVDLGAEDQAVELISSHLRVSAPSAVAGTSGVVRSLNPMADTDDVVFELLNEELASTARLGHHMNSDDLWLTTRSNVLWSLDHIVLSFTVGDYSYSVNKVWVWDDPLATPVIPESPSDGTQLTSTSEVTLEWAELDDADEYEISLYRYCPQCPDEKDPVAVDNSEDTCAIVEGLKAGSTYYWKVRVAEGEPFLSKWSELWEFNTALGEVPDLCSPICGGQDIILTTNFSWDAVTGASGYELQIVAASADGTSDFTGAETLTTDVNALASFPGLDYSTTYYWRVRAVSDGIPGAWSVCLFSTEGPPPEPVEPVEPVVIPPVEEITPMWIWVIIGIGAALMIAVIILIVSTRRVP